MMLFPDLPKYEPQVPRVQGSTAWREALEVFESAGMRQAKARTFIGMLKKRGLSDEDLLSIARSAKQAGTLAVESYFSEAARQALTRRGSVSEVTRPSDTRQHGWMLDWAEGRPWDRTVRGPEPGEAGCRVTMTIQQQYRRQGGA
jgi:hypothetical protein